MRTSIIGRPRPLSRQRRADPDYTLKCEEPIIAAAIPAAATAAATPGDVYIAEANDGQVVKVPAGGAAQTIIATGLSNAKGVAVDAAENVYIVDTGHGQVVEVPADGGTQTTIESGLSSPRGMAVDAAGNLYIADNGNSQVVEVPAGGGVQTMIGTGLNEPYAVAVFAPPPTLVFDSPPLTGAVNSPYAGYTYTATSPAGEPAAMFRVATGTLPPGLRVDLATGNLTGTPTTAGTFTFQIQAGNYATAAVGPATNITVAKGSQSISFTSTAPSSAEVSGATYAVAATGGASGASLTFASTTRPVCTVTGSMVSFNDAGTCTIEADQAGNANYLAAPQKSQSFAVISTPGDLCIADNGNDRVVKVRAGGGAQTSIGTGLNGPYAVAVDAAGNVYIADTNNNRVVEVPAGSGTQTSIATGLHHPLGVAVDAAGNVYIADSNNNRVVEVPAGGGTQTTIGTGLSYPIGVAVDLAGNVYIADSGHNRVVVVGPGGFGQATIVTGLSYPSGVAVDTFGDVLTADSNNNRVVIVGPFPQTIDTGPGHPLGVAVDANRNLYFVHNGDSWVAGAPASGGPASGGPQGPIATGLSNPTGVAVFAPPPTLVLDSPPLTGAVNSPYAGYVYTATSPAGEPAAMFWVASGVLPPGLRVDLATGNLTGTPTTAGTFTFRVQAGNYATATVGPATTIAVAKGSQSVSFTSTAPSSAAVGGTSYAVAAAGVASGAPVTFTSATTSVCTVTGSTLSFTGVGTCTIDADQAGNANYLAAVENSQSFAVGAGSQSISFTSTAPSPATVHGTTYAVAATGGASGRPVTFTVDPATTNSACSITEAIVAFARTGNCLIDANQAGDDNYNAAPQTQQIITVGKGANPLTFISTVPHNARAGDTYTPIVTGRPGGPIAVTITPTGAGSRCRLTGGVVTFTGAGRCVINADDPGDDDYASATVTQTVTIAAGQITFPPDTTLSNGTVGQPYRAQLGQPSGGLPPYSWTSTGAALPAGLHLNSLTGAITGTPTAAGTFSLTITITDSEDPVTATHHYQLTITTSSTATGGSTSTGHRGRILLRAGSVPATDHLTLTFTGLPAGSVDQVVLDTVLATFTATAAGTGTVVVSIPAETIPGPHTITVINTAGLVLASVSVSITAGVAGAAGQSPSAGAGLPTTGFPVTDTLWIGLLTVLAGLALTISSRRRRATSRHA